MQTLPDEMRRKGFCQRSGQVQLRFGFIIGNRSVNQVGDHAIHFYLPNLFLFIKAGFQFSAGYLYVRNLLTGAEGIRSFHLAAAPGAPGNIISAVLQFFLMKKNRKKLVFLLNLDGEFAFYAVHFLRAGKAFNEKIVAADRVGNGHRAAPEHSVPVLLRK